MSSWSDEAVWLGNQIEDNMPPKSLRFTQSTRGDTFTFLPLFTGRVYLHVKCGTPIAVGGVDTYGCAAILLTPNRLKKLLSFLEEVNNE